MNQNSNFKNNSLKINKYFKIHKKGKNKQLKRANYSDLVKLLTILYKLRK